jgi:thiamine biosynthesis lipoprotein
MRRRAEERRLFPPRPCAGAGNVVFFAAAFRLLLRAAILVGVAGCAAPRVATLSGPTMGTTWTVKLVAPRGADLAQLQHGIQGEVDRVVAQMSTYEADSDLSRFNRAPGGTWQELPPEFFDVLDHALALAHDSGGAYDPTVGPLVNLWGFGPGAREHKVPADGDIQAARARLGWDRIRLDRERHRALQPGGVYVDLSAIAKGFGSDQVARYLERGGVQDYLVDISGELRAHGTRPGGAPWQVAIEKPGAAEGAVERSDQVWRVLALRNRSIATSGDYRHFFEDAGRSYSHHIDPRTGRPVEHRIASVTTVADDCMDADAMGTTIMVLGAEAGLAFAERRGAAVLLLLHDGDGFVERTTPAFAALLAEAALPLPRE